MTERTSDDLRAQRDERTADYDAAQVTPTADDEAVGRVGGTEDETFARTDGAEARGAAASAEDDESERSERPDVS